MAITTVIPLSPSVQSAASRFAPEERIVSWAFVRTLLEVHPEYGNGTGSSIAKQAGPTVGERRTMGEWMDALQSLFDPSLLDQLHGRVAILGLARLDSALRDFLAREKFLAALASELKEPFDSLLRQANASPTAGAGTGSPGSLKVYTIAGYASDWVGEGTADRLDIEHEVETIAHLLVSKRVIPPLSLGLFGDWGTGKSFFMTKLQSYIRAIADFYRGQERSTGVSSDWCTRVLQIEFNAWHYSDANLWASLVTRIYEALQAELQPGEDLKGTVEKKVAQAQGIAREATQELVKARERVNSAKQAVQEQRAKRQAQEKGVWENLNSVSSLLSQERKAELERAAKELGIPQAATTYRSLRELHRSVGSVGGQMTTVARLVLQAPGASRRTLGIFLALAGAAILLPLVVFWGIERFGGSVGPAAEFVTQFGAAVTALVVFIEPRARTMAQRLKQGLDWVQTVQVAAAEADARRRDRIEHDPEIVQAMHELALAEAGEKAALQNLQTSQAELQTLEAELSQLAPERRLYRLLEERGRSATYSQHLGIISLIREDLDTMSDLFMELEKEARDLRKEPPPIQRIILYIDDLDRCPAERVLQVLEAVHMLLAFPLFTVVVGVDPRWLRAALATAHPSTLGATTTGRSSAYATPQDYLEKIFQIPFALRRVDKHGYQNLVADLLAPPASLPNGGGGGTGAGGADGAGASAAEAAGAEGSGAGGASLGATTQSGPASTDSPSPGGGKPLSFEPIQAEQLEFSEWEKRDIDHLWPLFTNPRTVKRFINTYRLMRAGLRPHETARFIGSEGAPGEYQVALLLLAVVSSAPNEMAPFKRAVFAWARTPDPRGKSGSWSWRDVLDASYQPIVDADRAWEDTCAALRKVTDAGFHRTFTKEEVARWVLRVSRYSFNVISAKEEVA